MTPRTRTRRGGARALVVTTALAAVVGLGACSAVGDPSVAAYVDGEPLVTQAEVATVVDELPPEVSGGQPVAPSQVLTFLAIAPTVADLAREQGTLLGDVEAGQALAGLDEQAGRPVGDYSEPTLRLIATNLMLNELGQSEAAPLIQESITDLAGRLEVNPRYGEVTDGADGLLVPVQHPWLGGGADA